MKQTLAVVMMITAMLCGCTKKVAVNPPAPSPNADHSITLTWNQSFANNGVCSATVATSCISGFNEGYISGTSTQNQLHADSSAVCTATCTSTFNGVLPIGAVTFYVATTYVDQDGVAGVTAAATTATPNQVAADVATNVVAKINN